MGQYVIIREGGKEKIVSKDFPFFHKYPRVRDCTYEEEIQEIHRRNAIGSNMWTKGYYKIIELGKMVIYEVGESEVAIVEYKEKLTDPFVKLSAKMRLQPLFNSGSTCNGNVGDKAFYKANPKELIGRTIKILSIELVPFFENGKEVNKTYEAHWNDLDSEKPKLKVNTFGRDPNRQNSFAEYARLNGEIINKQDL